MRGTSVFFFFNSRAPPETPPLPHHTPPPVCRPPIPVLALPDADSPPGLHRGQPAGARVPPPGARGTRGDGPLPAGRPGPVRDRKSTRLNSSHANISYAVFCLKKKKTKFPPIF